MTFYRRLGEGLLERRAPPRDAFQIEPKALKRWIDTLPLANASVAARMLFQAIRELNCMVLDPVARLAALEGLRGPVLQLTEAIDRQVVGSSFPLPPQRAQLGAAARDFQQQMALGYRLAAYELCAPDGRVPFLRGKTVALALERAIGHLGAELCKGYLLYAAPPDGLWRILNALFGFALACRLDGKSVDDVVAGGSSTPRETFAQVLLLAISNPYRLTQKEIQEASHVVRAWAPLPVLRGAVAGEHVCAIPLDADRGPGYLPEERSADGAARLSFDTAPLEAELERQLALVEGLAGNLSFRVRGGGATVSVSADLVRRLVGNWQFNPERAYRRLPAGHLLDTAVGMHAVHFFLAGGVDFEAVVRRACGTAVHVTERERSGGFGGAELSRPEINRARVLDQGLGGYRVLWERADAVRARIGEVVAVAASTTVEDPAEVPHDERDWMIGTIRWMRIAANGSVDAGIELLSREARVAVVRSMDAQRHPRPSSRGLLLLAPRSDGSWPAAVLAPALLERGAPSYEFRAMPGRWSGAEDLDIIEQRDIDVAEQTGPYLRILLPVPARAGDTPPEAEATAPEAIAAQETDAAG
jgi:hypothetical protein